MKTTQQYEEAASTMANNGLGFDDIENALNREFTFFLNPSTRKYEATLFVAKERMSFKDTGVTDQPWKK